jgi:hypothetical protein
MLLYIQNENAWYKSLKKLSLDVDSGSGKYLSFPNNFN